MKSSTEYDPKLAWGLLLQGPPKTGKTRLALCFPNPYILDCDNNLSGAVRSLRTEYPDKTFKYDSLHEDDAGNPLPPEKLWDHGIQCLVAACKDTTIRTIIIDSLSSLCPALIDKIVASKAGTGRAEGMTISDWIPFRNMLSDLVTRLRRTKRYLIITSHEENVKDELSGMVITRTNMPSKLADSFGGFFSDVWRTEIDELGGKPIYTVRVSPTKRIPAIGNSLGLTPTNGCFVFRWEDIAKHLEASQHLTTPKK